MIMHMVMHMMMHMVIHLMNILSCIRSELKVWQLFDQALKSFSYLGSGSPACQIKKAKRDVLKMDFHNSKCTRTSSVELERSQNLKFKPKLEGK